jgi:hypothetical protein
MKNKGQKCPISLIVRTNGTHINQTSKESGFIRYEERNG